MANDTNTFVQSEAKDILRLDAVSFSYGNSSKRALDAIDLTVQSGDFVGVLGAAGAGKTTLCSLLSGAIPHHYAGDLYGSVLIDGQDSCEISLTDISKYVASIQQDIDAQMVAAEVFDEILYGLENFGVDHTEIESRIDEALAIVEIGDLKYREIASLSGGQRQKVAIAALLAMKPRVMVLDEPTAALDPASSRAVYETLAKLNHEEGITIVVVEQKIALLSEFCSKLIVLEEGKKVLEGSAHEVFKNTDYLRSIGVDSPRVTRISNKLQQLKLLDENTLAVNVDEAFDIISRIVGRNSRPSSVVKDFQLAAQAGSDPVLELSNVAFSYGEGQASLENIDFAVAQKEILAIVGQNGAGKTTLTKLLNGLLRPKYGSLRVCGKETSAMLTSDIARHISTLFQNPDRSLCKNTVREELLFSCELKGMTSDEAEKETARLIDRFKLDADVSPFSLSKGQRQIVCLASVLVGKPDVLVLDEPTSGLDYRECMQVMEAVQELQEAGSAVVMVCHDMEVVSDFATRLLVMVEGKIQADVQGKELFFDDELMKLARLRPPQVIELSSRLAREVSPSFAGLSEVRDLVNECEKLSYRG